MKPFLKSRLHPMIRVNHAGERAAVNLYEGQLDGCRDPEMRPVLRSMLENEQSHLRYFTEVMRTEHVRPSFFLPLWDALSYGVGYLTGRRGSDAMMRCTAAVETVIAQHYREQEEVLTDDDAADLKEKIAAFREEEELHHQHAKGYYKRSGFFFCLIKQGCRVAIQLSKRW